MMWWVFAFAVVCLALAAPMAVSGRDDVLLDAAEIKRVLLHGPWPPAAVRDPSNRASGNPDAIALGEQLFFEPRLAVDGTMSCATCHVPARGWTDGRPRGVGAETLDRNTPSLWNVGRQRWFGWDGAGDSLWAQSVRPILERREMAASARHVATLLASDAALGCRYTRAFGRPPGAAPDDETLLVDSAKALAAFMETLVSGPTPFDDFRAALARGDAGAARRYPAAARRGLALFVGTGRCSVCHFGPAFTNGEFSDVGVPFFVGRGRVDAGRHGGIKQLRASPFNLLSRHSDDRSRESATKTRYVELQHRNFGEFKVPALRNVARTAPYMHDGRYTTLRDVVRHYSELNEERLHADGERILRALRLSPGQVDDLVAFLESLSDAGTPYAPQAAPPGCP
jgi:cytochrome c peroxidase